MRLTGLSFLRLFLGAGFGGIGGGGVFLLGRGSGLYSWG